MPTQTDLAEALDAEAGRVLRVIEREGGEADTTEIRTATNLSNGQVRRRRERLVELELIDTSCPDADGRNPPTVHKLTEEGEAALDHGLLTRLGVADLDADPQVLGTLKELHADVRELLDRVDDLERRERETRGALRSRLGDAGKGTSSVSEEIAAVREELDERLADVDDRLGDKKDKRFI